MALITTHWQNGTMINIVLVLRLRYVYSRSSKCVQRYIEVRAIAHVYILYGEMPEGIYSMESIWCVMNNAISYIRFRILARYYQLLFVYHN